jgi:hypothetical protein
MPMIVAVGSCCPLLFVAVNTPGAPRMGLQQKRVFEPGASAQCHGEKIALAEPGMWPSRLVACSASTV